jgi:hypothetical protein
MEENTPPPVKRSLFLQDAGKVLHPLPPKVQDLQLREVNFGPQVVPPGPGTATSWRCNSARAIKGAMATTVVPSSGTAVPTMPAERMAMAVGAAVTTVSGRPFSLWPFTAFSWPSR